MLVGDDQPHPAQTALFQGAQESAPKHLVFGVADIDAEYLAAAGRRDPGRHDDGHRGDLARPADVQVSGIEEHIRETGVVQGPRSECFDLLIEPGANPGDLRLRDPGLHA